MFKKIVLIHGLLILLEEIHARLNGNVIKCLPHDTNIFNGRESLIDYSNKLNNHAEYDVVIKHDNNCKYNVQLHYDSDLSEDECRNITHIKLKQNSLSNFISNEDYSAIADNCSQIQLSFSFTYWFDGCYVFEIHKSKCLRNTNGPIIFHPVWISNKHEIKDFDIYTPSFTYDSDSGTNLTVKWMFDNQSFINNEINYAVYPPNGEPYECELFKDYWYIIECRLTELVAGHHEITLELEDIGRCRNQYKEQTCVWTNSIVKREPIEMISKEVTLIASAPSWFTGIFIGFGLIFLIIAMSLSIIHYKRKQSRKKWNKSFDNHVCDGVECCLNDMNIKGIFLLYSRDCDAFMKTMEQFRILLEKATACKVYDIYDKARFNEIAESSFSWIETLIHDPQIKILIPATECAHILYTNLKRLCAYPNKNESPPSHVQFYKEPNYLDSLFMYALKNISSDVTPVPYHKFFVVSLTHMGGSDGYLPTINPFKRFDLPKNLQILCDSIMGYYPGIKTDDGLYSQIQKVGLTDCATAPFIEALESLKTYSNNNRSYLLKDLLKYDLIKNSEEFC